MNDVVVSKDQTQVRVGVGNRWGAVNHYLDSFSLATVSGRISGVGVGGFTSGGDYVPIILKQNKTKGVILQEDCHSTLLD